jgi:predicted SAM-dependent methyltransferase
MIVSSSTERHGGVSRTERLRKWGLLHLTVSLSVVFFEIRVFFLHGLSKWRARRYRNERQLRLHFGCGDNAKAGWVNIDLSSKADLQLDLRKALPFSDKSCALTYSEHFFEHLDYPDDAVFFLRENFRVLEPGGIISFGVPNAPAALQEYVRNKAKGRPIAPFPGHPSWVRTGLDQINFLFRQNYSYLIQQHRYAYDLETLKLILTDAGFSEVQERTFDPMLDSISRGDSTLYVNARKI